MTGYIVNMYTKGEIALDSNWMLSVISVWIVLSWRLQSSDISVKQHRNCTLAGWKLEKKHRILSRNYSSEYHQKTKKLSSEASTLIQNWMRNLNCLKGKQVLAILKLK